MLVSCPAWCFLGVLGALTKNGLGGLLRRRRRRRRCAAAAAEAQAAGATALCPEFVDQEFCKCFRRARRACKD